VIKEIECFAH
jgi:hypothetical protein